VDGLVLPAELRTVVDGKLRGAVGLGTGSIRAERPVAAGKLPHPRSPKLQRVIPHRISAFRMTGVALSTNGGWGWFVPGTRGPFGQAGRLVRMGEAGRPLGGGPELGHPGRGSPSPPEPPPGPGGAGRLELEPARSPPLRR